MLIIRGAGVKVGCMDLKTVRAEQNRTARAEELVRTDKHPSSTCYMLHATCEEPSTRLYVSESIDTENTPSMPYL